MEFALVDDPEALHAALALVDECAALSPVADADEEQALALAAVASFDSPSARQERGNGDDSARSLSVSSVSSSSPTSAVAQGGRKKAAKTRNYNPNRAREEEKRELLYLRGKVVEMENKLHALQEAKRAKESALALEDEASSSALRPLSARARNVWEEMANHQLEQRLQSERENRHLKAVLEAQIKIAKGLEKLLQSRATAKGMETAGFSSRSRRIYASKANRSGAELFQELIDGLEESYNELDSVFRANGLAGMEMSFKDAKMCEDKDGNLYMEMYANKVLPFDVRESGNAAWQYFAHSMEHIPFRLMYQKDPKNLECTNDMVVQSFGMELHANGTKADFQVKQTQRRFVEEDREVIVWRSFIDPVEFSGKPLSGAEFLEKGYIVVKPSADDESLTLLQSCFIVTPVLPVRNLDEGAITGALTDFVLSGTAATIAASHQMIENILFDQAAKARSRV